MTNLNAEYFKLMGWESCQVDHPMMDRAWADGLRSPDGKEYALTKLPNVAGDWQVFHDRVVLELLKGATNLIYSPMRQQIEFNEIKHKVGKFFCDQHNKTPEAALRWAMKEMGNEH